MLRHGPALCTHLYRYQIAQRHLKGSHNICIVFLFKVILLLKLISNRHSGSWAPGVRWCIELSLDTWLPVSRHIALCLRSDQPVGGTMCHRMRERRWLSHLSGMWPWSLHTCKMVLTLCTVARKRGVRILWCNKFRQWNVLVIFRAISAWCWQISKYYQHISLPEFVASC